jgi:hypothetical protein
LAPDLLSAHRDAGQAGVLASIRVAMTARSRYTEERLAEAGARRFLHASRRRIW